MFTSVIQMGVSIKCPVDDIYYYNQNIKTID